MRSKQDKALDLLESIGQADERLVQHALHVDNPEKFMLLSQGSAVKRWGTLAACLALVLALAAFPWLLSKLPASLPATQPPQTTTTHPTQPTTTGGYTAEEIAGWITRLQNAVTLAEDSYTAALAYVTADFEAKPEGTTSPVFTEMAEQMAAARDARIAALSVMADALNRLDLKDIDAVAAKLAKAEELLSECHHSYSEKIYHSGNTVDIDCTAKNYYQVCADCNTLLQTKGEHDWYYVRTLADHQLSCRGCSTTQDAMPHNPNAQGKCEDCNYTVNANILIIESIDGESAGLRGMIDESHSLTVVNIRDSEKMPVSLEELKVYDEVILVNIANKDMPTGFAELLQSYVRDFGGGLLTVGGDKAYQPEDMGGTTYEELLPVDMTVPSMAVMIIVDTSGSMWYPGSEEPYETSKLFAAVQGAEACLDVLCENDYVGVMSLADYYTETIELTPRTQRDKIMAAIADLPNQGPGGTVFSAALERAGQALKAMTNVDKRHIILITDGEPTTPDFEAYTYAMKQNAAQGITMSIVGIQCTSYAVANMTYVLKECAGMSEKNFYDVQDLQYVDDATVEDLSNPARRAFQYKNYIPYITASDLFPNITQEQMPALGGTYYSKRKENAVEVLGSPYGPLYAQWQCGKGMVGSFMCDLNGTWSEEFIQSETGRKLLNMLIALLANPDHSTA